MDTIGSYIRERRKNKRWSRKDLSRKAKVSEIEIYRIEKDQRKNINLQIMAKIAKALDFSLVSMLIETGFSSPMTDSEKKLLTDPDFAKIFFELGRRRDLKKEDKKQLADILIRIIMSFSEREK